MTTSRDPAAASTASVTDTHLASMVDDPDDPGRYIALGHQFYRRGCPSEAATCFRRAIALDPNHSDAHHLLGWILELQGDAEGALASYSRALTISPDHQNARRNLAILLVRLGRRDESLPLWHQELANCPDTYNLMRKLVSDAMKSRSLTLAGDYSIILAQLRWGGRFAPYQPSSTGFPHPAIDPEVTVTIPKLLHDIAQFEYLQRRNILGEEFNPIIAEYRRIVELLEANGPDVRMPLSGEIHAAIGHIFDRIVHIRDTPRVERVFSSSWNPEDIEESFLSSDTGLLVIDDFLSREALEELLLFCMESTVWSGNRYAHGRIGAFMQEGFICPLLLQIAEDLRSTLPRVIGDRYPLRAMWGFKTWQELPPDSTNHADFAAVNVNFWITPDSANLDEDSGGLVVYDVDAPLSWEFHAYNGRLDMINSFLRSKQSRSVNIPYRQNRAVIFNSDLFHASAGVKFRPGYENTRINITMLYGEREYDVHHPNLSQEDGSGVAAGGQAAWRSAAFSRIGR